MTSTAAVRTSIPGLILASSLGIALGFASRAIDHVPLHLDWVGNIGGVWLVAAFLAGALAGGRWTSLLAGSVSLGSGIVAYYLYKAAEGTFGPMAQLALPVWLVLAVVAGAIYGWLGGWWAVTVDRRLPSALLSLSLLLEAMFFVASGRGRPTGIALEVIGAGLLAVVLALPGPGASRGESPW